MKRKEIKCKICNEHIDRSDANKTFTKVTIARHLDNEVVIPSKTYYLCSIHSCSLDLFVLEKSISITNK